MHPGIARFAERLGLDATAAREILRLRQRIMPHMRARVSRRPAASNPLRVTLGDELRWKLGR